MRLISALASATLIACAGASIMPAAQADEDAKINARIEAWGRSCKNAVAAKYPKAAMADIRIELGATLKSLLKNPATAGVVSVKS
jgi:hypothetical protein